MEEYLRLLAEGADLDIQNDLGITPLMVASKDGNLQLVKLLLKHVRNVNTEDKEGNTALFYAVENDHIDVVRLLHEHGAKISDFIYMYSITTKKRQIVRYFDMQDRHKQIFLKP